VIRVRGQGAGAPWGLAFFMEVASININEYVSSTCPLSHYLQNTPSCAKPSATDHYSGRYAYRTCRVVGPFNTL
jgi:hypothetical protein